jgi:predicted nucleic acid-binding protein
MAQQPIILPERLAVDCSTVCKWELAGEDYATEAREILQDWRVGVIEVCAPNLLGSEIISAFLKVFRQKRLPEVNCKDSMRNLLALPISLYEITPKMAEDAFDIASRFQTRSYDSIYVAFARGQGINLWTGDERLYNALVSSFPC